MGTDPRPASVPDLARVLRQARGARGLDLGAVSQETGIPLDQLQDLESGTVDRLPDRVAILKALSRYAAFLNLPGDQFVMTLVEHWPSAGTGIPPVVVVHDGPVNGSRPDDLSNRAVPLSVSTSSSPPTSVGIPVVEGRHNATAQVPLTMADTGVTRAITGQPVDGIGVVVVRALVIVAGLLLVVGTAWLVVNRVHPQWLADLHIPSTSNGVTGPVSTAAQGTTPTKSTTPPRPARPAVQQVSVNGSTANFNVTAPVFDVRVTAAGGASWVQMSGPLSTQPVYEQTLSSGQSHLVTADHQLTVQIGSTAARLAIQVNHRVIWTYVPPGAPFTMIFTTK
jgi:cytoskeletal protein RodZ